MDEKELNKVLDELKWESRIQTVAILLFFFLGVATLKDIVKKL